MIISSMVPNKNITVFFYLRVLVLLQCTFESFLVNPLTCFNLLSEELVLLK